MNTVARELAKKQTLQQFLLAMLEDVQKYFKTVPPMSEEKTFATINTIFNKINRDFPLNLSIANLSKRLIKNLKEKLNDKYQKSFKQKRKNLGLKSFMEGIQIQKQKQIEVKKHQENLYAWLKKILIEQIQQTRQDIRDADMQTSEILKTKLTSYFPFDKSHESTIVFLNSFLNNQTVFKDLEGIRVKSIVDFEAKVGENQIKIEDAPRHIKDALLVIISADAVLKNGGVLAKSGSLMLVTAAKAYNIPVIAISRSYCLSETLIFNQKSLVLYENPLNNFEKESDFKVLISKKFDIIHSKYIYSIVSESKKWERQNITQIFEDYYHLN